MTVEQQVRQCMDDCNKVVGQLRSLAQGAPNPDLKLKLLDSVRHAELCLAECRFASDAMRAEPGGPTR